MKIKICLSILAGMLYNAWILAFWLNPKIVNSKLLSGLGARNQPYHQVFIATDVLCGIVCLVLIYSIFQQIKKAKLLLLAWIGFAITTLFAALFATETADFKAGISDLILDPIDFLHDIMSVFTLLFLILAIALSVWKYRSWDYLLLGIIFFVTCLIAFVEGIAPGTFGPRGQQVNSIIAGIWMIRITWTLLHEPQQVS